MILTITYEKISSKKKIVRNCFGEEHETVDKKIEQLGEVIINLDKVCDIAAFKKVVRITSIKPCVVFEFENGKTESIYFKDFEMAMRFIGDVKGLLESTAVNVSFLCNCKCDSGILNFENDWVKDFELEYVCPKKGEY